VISAQCAACSASTVFPRFLISALLLASALTIALPSHARPVRIDFDEAPFENNGGGWPDAFDDAVDATAGPAGGTLAFGLRLGDTLFDSFCVSEDGFVGLQVGSTTCTGTTPADYAAVIAPLFDPDLVSVFPAASYEAGSVSYSVGYVDLEAPYNLDEAVTAMRFFGTASPRTVRTASSSCSSTTPAAETGTSISSSLTVCSATSLTPRARSSFRWMARVC